MAHFGTISGNASAIALREELRVYASAILGMTSDFDWPYITGLKAQRGFATYRHILIRQFADDAAHIEHNPDYQLEFCDDY